MMPRMITSRASAVLLLCVLFLTGCATPVGVTVVSPRDAYRAVYTNPLSAGVASEQAKFVLHRYDLLKKFDSDPAAAIADLYEQALHDDRRDILYALAEYSYLYAGQLEIGTNQAHKKLAPDYSDYLDYPDYYNGQFEKSADQANKKLAPDYYLFSALSAYWFLLDERSDPPPTKFDHRVRNALDLYSFGLWQGLSTGPGGGLALEGQVRKLPFGQLAISLNTSQFPWSMEDFEKFEPIDKYTVRGVSVLNRTAGVGAPLIGIKKASDSIIVQTVPVTAFLRLQGNLASLSAGTATAALELYSAQDSSSLLLNNNALPLETDITTPLAYKLEGNEIWDLGLSAFLGKELNKLPDGLYLQEAYRPEKIPVVFVHGTASNPVTWTEMFNTLRFDPLIRQKYQFWFFVYTSGKPVAYSAADLRDVLRDKVAILDPEGKNQALQQMVVIGHSQGGLLTKLTVVDTGDKLLKALTEQDLESLELSDEIKDRLRRLLYVKPLPFVKEVIFISTPHRGSFRSYSWARDIARFFVTLPSRLVESARDYYEYFTDDVKKLVGGKNRAFTSADSMSPDNPMIKTLAEIPLAPGVKGHSIIAVKGAGDPKLGDDGVVKFTSAHIEGMESEFIVRNDHSAQQNPLAIDEVRRILVEHITDFKKGE